MLTVQNPATGETLRSIETDSLELIRAKCQESRKAQKVWAKTPLEKRAAILRRWGDLLQFQQEELAELLTQETGKLPEQAKNEIRGVESRLRFFLAHVEKASQIELVSGEGDSTREEIQHEPLGVIANISAWNYPYFVGANVFVPALLTGNAVLYKPSEFATLTGLAIARLFGEAGLPPHLFSPILGMGDAGQWLVQQPVDGVFFTGSYATGMKIAAQLRSNMTRLQLELGGKDAAYVCEDADLPKTAQSLAEGVFYNTGQSCCSIERIYVHHMVHDRFVAEFCEAAAQFPTGPLTRPAQLDVLDRQARDALDKGASLLLGGKRKPGPGNFYESTVFTGVNHDMALMREESFGPIIGIQKVQDDTEAIAQMNDSEYGLTAAVYCQSLERARNLLAQIDVGTAYWNCCDRVSAKLPWSGRRHSGMGITLSVEGIRSFLKPKAWHLTSHQP